MEDGFQKVQDIAQRMKYDRQQGFAPSAPVLTPREFASWFGYERRSPWLVETVRNHLDSCGLHTEPDFNDIGPDDDISIFDSIDPPSLEDKTLLVDSLPESQNNPIRVSPNDDLKKATTLMASHDFSQLPVMTSDREVKGIITWKSIGLALQTTGNEVRFYMDNSPQIIEGSRPLFEAVRIISEQGYVLVRGQATFITGIITATDLNDRILQLTEAFLLVGEIESHIRCIIHCKFTRDEISKVIDGSDGPQIESTNNLSFGNYCRLLQTPDNWSKLGIQDDQSVFVEQLNQVKDIRNDVMHFNFANTSRNEVQKLRTLAPFFRSRAHPPAA